MQKTLASSRQGLRDPRQHNVLRAPMRILLALLALSMVMTLLSACSSNDPQAQQRANQSYTILTQTVQHAQSIGTPSTDLQPVLTQEQALAKTQAPFALFNGSATTDYYNNLATRYKQLTVQTEGIVQVATEEMAQQAQDSLEKLKQTLAAKQANNLPLDTLTQFYNQQQSEMQKARYPRDFITIDTQATNAIAAVGMLPDTLKKLETLNLVITLMKQGHQDISSLQKNYDDDKTAASSAVTPQALAHVDQTIDTQSQHASSMFLEALPLLTQARVDELSNAIQQLKKYGINASDDQKLLDAANIQMATVKTMQQYQSFSTLIDNDITSMRGDLLKGQTTALVKQFHSEVDAWGNAHQYHDLYNGQSYALDDAYMAKGIGEDLDRELSGAANTSDYQQGLTDTQNALFHLHMLEADAQDNTPYSQVHATDRQLLDYYKLGQSKVIVVSFIEEALRVYDHGKLVYSFLITAGRPELPPVPGLWQPMWRQTKTVFKSPYPKGSPYWYEDTPINYAIMYHSGGYFLHDSWWRANYGPYTQFYHIDSSGNVSANNGTHGCVNMPEDQAAWVYNYTDYNTQIVMY